MSAVAGRWPVTPNTLTSAARSFSTTLRNRSANANRRLGSVSDHVVPLPFVRLENVRRALVFVWAGRDEERVPSDSPQAG